MDLFDSARRSPAAWSMTGWLTGLEPLEPRVFLSNTPLPDLADMEDQDNTLVRIETDFGTIDLEMFDVAGPDGALPAPETVKNFLDRIGEGDYDLSFFHRFAKRQDGRDFVLQGGGFKWDDTEGLVPTEERESVDNEFDEGRSNIARTIAMARLGGDVDSATSQWFFNLRNNATLLDDDTSHAGTDDGYCVFGKVLDNDSWTVIQSIIELTTEDFRDPTDPGTGALAETPTKHDLASDATPSEAELVNITDVEVIKAANSGSFYRLRSAYPEGFRGSNTIETLDLVNPSTDVAVIYKVIVRYEKGLGRDQVISTGTMDPNTHLHIPVNDFNDPTLDLVRVEAPYSYEVWATGPVAAALSRTDFGTETNESFTNVDQASPTQLQTWSFGGTGTLFDDPDDSDIIRRPFLVWENLGFEPAEVTITFTLQTGGRVIWHRTTDPMRRDGLEVYSLQNVTRDVASIRITADQRLVAAFTVYDTFVDPLGLPPAPVNYGFTSGGTIGGGLSDGVIAGAQIGAAGPSYVSFVNDTNSGAAVTLSFVRDGEAVTTHLLAVPARGRAFYNLRHEQIPAGETFTIRYHSPLVIVAGEYVSTLNGDTASTPFATYGSSQTIFAGGGLDPTDSGESEVLSLYNPYTQKTLSVSITFNFSDDKIQTPTTFTLDPQSRVDISVASLAAIVAKINSGAAFKHYAIIVNVALDGGGTGGSIGAAGLVAMLTRFDDSGAISTNGSLYQLTLALDSATYAQP